MDNHTSTAAPNPGGLSHRATENQEIRSIGRLANLGSDWADGQIDAGASPEQARAMAFEAMSKRSAPMSSISVGRSYDDPLTVRGAMATALAHRLTNGVVPLEGQAMQFRGYGALDMLGSLAELQGERISRFDREALVTRALAGHSSADFSLLLADASNKSLLAQYQAAPQTYRKLAAPRPFQDFKSHKFLRLGSMPAYTEVKEGGAVKYGTISENQETVTASTFATGIVIGRTALLNDDLSALSDFSQLIAIRTANFENQKVYALLASNGPTMADGYAMFASQHTNKAASGTTIANGIDAAVQAFRSQTDKDGMLLGIRPEFLVCGPAREAAARRMLATINPVQAADVNPWANAFELVVDAQITGNRWFLAADPAALPTLIYGYVNGAAGPQAKVETDFDTQAVKIRASIDFAAGVIDTRGFYLNEGA